jgi:hypothetical protein
MMATFFDIFKTGLAICSIPVLLVVVPAVLYCLFCNLMVLLHVGDIQYPYAYKVLSWDGSNWKSPWWTTTWNGNWLYADVIPTADNTNGIYCFKNYWNWDLQYCWVLTCAMGGRIVKIQMAEPVVEHERGYRPYRAEVVR